MPHGKLAMDINSSSSSSDNGRFKFCIVFEYLSRGKYPENFDKKDKLALRKRSKFFICRGQHFMLVDHQVSVLIKISSIKDLVNFMHREV